MGPSLSACLIVRDEAEQLPRCLASLAGVVDEVVVVDTGSADASPALAIAAGARLLRAPWTGDFAAARNHSLAAARSDWCLVLDADEELPEATRGGLRAEVAVAATAGLDALLLVMRNLNPPGEVASWFEFGIVRLFRSDPRYRYQGAIHEQVTPSIQEAGGRVGRSALRILHHGYARKTAQGSVRRAERNLEALDRALAAAPGDPYLRYQRGVTLKALGAPGAAAELERALAMDAVAPAQAALSPEARAAAHMRLAQLALARGDDGAAAEAARRCLALEAGNLPALQILGVTAFALGRLEEAARAFEAVLQAENLAPEHRPDFEALVRASRLGMGAGR